MREPQAPGCWLLQQAGCPSDPRHHAGRSMQAGPCNSAPCGAMLGSGRMTCVCARACPLSWLLQVTAAMKREARKVREAERVEKLALTRKDREEIFEVSEALSASDALPRSCTQHDTGRHLRLPLSVPYTHKLGKLSQA